MFLSFFLPCSCCEPIVTLFYLFQMPRYLPPIGSHLSVFNDGTCLCARSLFPPLEWTHCLARPSYGLIILYPPFLFPPFPHAHVTDFSPARLWALYTFFEPKNLTTPPFFPPSMLSHSIACFFLDLHDPIIIANSGLLLFRSTQFPFPPASPPFPSRSISPPPLFWGIILTEVLCLFSFFYIPLFPSVLFSLV